MEDDVAALKKGEAPVGFGMQKQTYVPPPPPPAGPPGQSASQAPQSFSQTFPKAGGGIELGKTEKAKPLSGSSYPRPSTPAPTPPSPGQGANIELGKTEKAKSLSPTPMPGRSPLPSLGRSAPVNPASATPAYNIPPPKKGGLSPTVLIIAVVILAIVGFSVWFFVFHQPQATLTNQPTPNGTIIVSATPIPAIETVFPVVDSVTLEASSASFSTFKDIVSPQIQNSGEAGLYKVFRPQKANGDQYAFSEFMTGSGVNVPQNIVSLLNDQDFYITAIREANNSIGYGFIVGVKGSSADLQAALTPWESGLSDALKYLFGFDETKAASPGFNDNLYEGVHIRYRNFPTPVSTIDYAVITTADGNSFLVFTNSKEHIYSIIDKMRTIIPLISVTPTLSPSPSQ
ncbi:MAG: hypothetical protein ABR875_03140 [Minisyncoccia bacterium]